MNFKEQLALDHAVFLNLDEFAELINIEGKTIPAVVDDLALDYPNQLTDGLRQRRKRICIASENSPDMLSIGRIISFEHDEWIVEEVRAELGMSILTISKDVY